MSQAASAFSSRNAEPGSTRRSIRSRAGSFPRERCRSTRLLAAARRDLRRALAQLGDERLHPPLAAGEGRRRARSVEVSRAHAGRVTVRSACVLPRSRARRRPGVFRSARAGARSATLLRPELARAHADLPSSAGELEGLARARPSLIANSMGCQVAPVLAVRTARSRGSARPRRTDRRSERAQPVRQAFRLALDAWFEPPSLTATSCCGSTCAAGRRGSIQQARFALADAIEERLPRIGAPTLVIRGAHDPLCPARWGQEAAALLPDGGSSRSPAPRTRCTTRTRSEVASRGQSFARRKLEHRSADLVRPVEHRHVRGSANELEAGTRARRRGTPSRGRAGSAGHGRPREAGSARERPSGRGERHRRAASLRRRGRSQRAGAKRVVGKAGQEEGAGPHQRRRERHDRADRRAARNAGRCRRGRAGRPSPDGEAASRTASRPPSEWPTYVAGLRSANRCAIRSTRSSGS